MKRRNVITLLGGLALGGAAVLRNLLAFARPGPDEHVARTVAAVADLMFPGDGLPAATELHLHERVLAMPDLSALLTGGVASLDERAVAQGAADFLALDEAGRLAAMDAAFASHEDARRFLLALRYHMGMAYYAEPVIKAAFAYTGPPQPDGFADFQDPPA